VTTMGLDEGLKNGGEKERKEDDTKYYLLTRDRSKKGLLLLSLVVVWARGEVLPGRPKNVRSTRVQHTKSPYASIKVL